MHGRVFNRVQFLCSEFQVLGFGVCGFEILAFGGSRLMH